MSVDQLGWYYFDGRLRYKDSLGWTERYKPIDGPGALTPASTGASSEPAEERPSPGAGQPRRRMSHLVTAVCAGLLGLGLGLGLGAGRFNPEGAQGGISWASDQAAQVLSRFSPTAPSTPVPLAKAKVNANLTPEHPAATKRAWLSRDVNAFAPGGPSVATVPASYDHPSHPDCVKFRDQLRAWSDFQNAHRPIGFTHDLPSSGDVEYLQTTCRLSY